jgi:signal transduction histidine kinase
LDGGDVPVLVGVSVTQEPDGLLRCLTVTDLSPQKAQQQQMDRLNAQLTDRLAELRVVNAELDVEKLRVEEANAELQVVNSEIRGFTAAAAHDLRSPVSSIVGFSSILTQSWETFSDDKRREFVASIERQSKNLSRLVDELFTLSSIEGGGLTTSPELVVLGEAIARCLEQGSGDAADVAVSCSPDLVVRVDPQHLARILDNYVQNAFKYGEKPVRIDATRLGDMVEIRVLDHGPGVPADFASRLFGMFARADSPATKAQKGSGLGLSIVRGLAEANGGQAHYEPNVPDGSCFIVQLPAGDRPAT